MASFNFGNNDSEELDLSTGGDQGAPARKKPVTRQPAAPQNPAQRPPRPAAGTGRTANLLQGQAPVTPPATPRPQPQRPARQQPVQQPVQQPARPQAPRLAPAQQPVEQHPAATFPPSTPVEQPQQVSPAYVPEPAAYVPPADAPVYAPQPQAPAYTEPAQPQYQQPAPAQPSYDPQDFEEDFTPAPLPPRDAPIASRSNSGSGTQPSFMTRGGRAEPETEEPAEEPGNGQRVSQRKNPIAEFFAPFATFFAPNSAKGGTAKSGKANNNRKRGRAQSNYAGSRQRVLLIQVVGGFIVGIVLLTGARALLFPYQGPSKIAVQNAAKEAVGYTGFPDAVGEGTAVSFTSLLLNFNSVANTDRNTQLLRYTTSDILGDINLNYDTNAASAASGKPIVESVTAGPYVIGEKNIDATHALITTASRLNTGQWIYMSIPLLYTANTGSMTVYASPTFIPQYGPANVDPNTYTPQWQDDSTADNTFKPDLINYLTAWAAGTNQSVIQRYVTNDATDVAKKGLGGTVVYAGLVSGPTIEYIDPKSGTNPNSRRGQFTVTWENPDNGVQYNQTYRVQLEFQNDHWFIQDITNLSLISGN